MKNGLFWRMQGNANEHSKTLKTYRWGRGQQGTQRVWCKRSFPKKFKKSKFQKSKKKNFGYL